MMKTILALYCILLLTFTAVLAEDVPFGGTPTNSAEINYSFAWSAERDEQSAPLSDKADMHLLLCRREWESFQLLLKTPVEGQNVTVEITDFLNGAGDGFVANVYQVGYVAGEDGGFYPKTLKQNFGTPVELSANVTNSFLVEVYTGTNIAAGDYTATLTVKDESGAVILEKEITAEVYPVALPVMTYVEKSAGEKRTLPALTNSKFNCFLGYQGNSYDYFRIALEVLGQEWLDEHFDNVVTDIATYKEGHLDFFLSAREKLIKVLSGDMSEFREPVSALQFSETGDFKIMVFSDIHCGYEKKNLTPEIEQFFRAALEKEQPDLIVLLGDNINSEAWGFIKADEYIDDFMPIFEEYGAPVAMVFGNHEPDNGETTATKALQMAIYQSYDCFIGVTGPDHVTGVGNYNLPILSSDGAKTAFNLWFFDSGVSDADNYPTVRSQITWYEETSAALNAENGGQPLSSIVFQHIIVPEINDALVQPKAGTWALPEGNPGHLGENPCPTYYNNGQYAAFQKQGGVLAAVFGHDHVNSFVVEHEGINIINTPTCANLNYSDESIGVRVITLNESNLNSYETYIVQPTEFGIVLE